MCGLAATCSLAVPLPAPPNPFEVQDDSSNAFGWPLPSLTVAERRAFSVGNSFFRDNWVVAPASATGRDGLGPLFNAASCSACHPEDGRGRPPLQPGERGLGMVVLVSPMDADGQPHPVYGPQLQDLAIPGIQPEVTIQLLPVEVPAPAAAASPAAASPAAAPALATAEQGSAATVQQWYVRVTDPAYGPLGPVRLSVRMGPQLIGGGLLEAVPDAALLAHADPNDADQDGISGRASVLPDGRVGRFGWKAGKRTLEEQIAGALQQDMGITSPLRPDENHTAAQGVHAPSGGGSSSADHAADEPEATASKLQRLAHYCRALAVPAQRGADLPEVQRGAAVFANLGCTGCHTPTLQTGDDSPLPVLRHVEFRAYTDLLLHDMGPGLADHRAESAAPGAATGTEWRTPPLWGIGLIQTVNGHTRLLHDGRARSMEEAILWHDGEASASRRAFDECAPADRAALLAFLRSL